MSRVVVSVCLLAAVSASLPAAAQVPDEGSSTENRAARDLFRSGMDALRAGQYGEAVDALQRSYELDPSLDTLVNLSTAQGYSGRCVEAAEGYRRFLREDGGQHPQRDDVVRSLEAMEACIGRLRIDAGNLHLDDVLELDGQPLRHAVVGTPIDANPGNRRVSVRRDDEEIASETVEVRSAEQATVTLDLPERPPDTGEAGDQLFDPGPRPDRPRESRPTDDDGGTVFESPWLWLIVGAVVAAGVTIAVVLTLPEPDRFPASLGQLDI